VSKKRTIIDVRTRREFPGGSVRSSFKESIAERRQQDVTQSPDGEMEIESMKLDKK
jgi:hypothetical protein